MLAAICDNGLSIAQGLDMIDSSTRLENAGFSWVMVAQRRGDDFLLSLFTLPQGYKVENHMTINIMGAVANGYSLASSAHA